MESLGVYVLTFNCARNVIQPEAFAPHIFDALKAASSISPARTKAPEILAVALQEVAPIAYAFLGGSYLDPYYDALQRAVDLGASALVSDHRAQDAQYQHMLTKNIGMTALMVFARRDIVERIRYIQTAGVGVGVQEAGNKGAVGARIGYLVERDGRNQRDEEDDDGGVMEVTLVSAHLAPDESQWERRNEDWKNIAERLVFEPRQAPETVADATLSREDEEGVPLLGDTSSPPLKNSSAFYSPRSYLFVAGDFNYRTADGRPTPDDFKNFPRPTGDTANNISQFADLLARDQLTRERQAGKTFTNFEESKITFAPSYKYSDEARGLASSDRNGHWKWAENRWPSWCDRILYLNHPSAGASDGIDVHGYTSLPLLSTSDHRPVALSASIPLRVLPESSTYLPPFEIDPDWDSRRAAARRKEVIVGAAAYLGLTWAGNGLLAATVLGGTAAYYALQAYYVAS
ncbi:hypothetical protein LOZ51_001444 [Ophidiomyces ophidiicola]|nr:hypothetical protein LOZ55_005732 [Ophidiomyces ophidiicola]KAI1975175.1 hypothetical protein LOZ54_006690 [Ophidiomyces ophidiicola]KAI2001152.1 hypothetical protein LOZ51_001444 [Ophidiomyces ophidiicola]